MGVVKIVKISYILLGLGLGLGLRLGLGSGLGLGLGFGYGFQKTIFGAIYWICWKILLAWSFPYDVSHAS